MHTSSALASLAASPKILDNYYGCGLIDVLLRAVIRNLSKMPVPKENDSSPPSKTEPGQWDTFVEHTLYAANDATIRLIGGEPPSSSNTLESNSNGELEGLVFTPEDIIALYGINGHNKERQLAVVDKKTFGHV